MNDYIYLFQNFTPNTDGGIHYFPAASNNNFNQNYLIYLNTFSPYKRVDNNTYRAYETYIDISESAFYTGNYDPYNITYICVQRGTLYRYYYVNSVILTSSGYRFTIMPDNWANYIDKASITNCKVTRTNLLLNKEQHPLYTVDSLPNGAVNLQILTVKNLNLSTSYRNLRIYAVIEYQETDDSWTANDNKVYRKELIKFNPEDISETPSPALIPLLVEWVSTIYQYKGTYYNNLNVPSSATVTDIFIYPNITAEGEETQNYLIFEGIKPVTPWNRPIKAYKIGYNIIQAPLPLVNVGGGNYNGSYPVSLFTKIPEGNLGKTIKIGTTTDNITLPPFVNDYVALFTVITTSAAFEVNITAGNDTKDITNAFRIPFANNRQSLTDGQKQVKWLQVLAQGAGNVYQLANGIASENYLNAAAGATGLGQTAVNAFPIGQKSGNYANSEATGYITFKEIIEQTATQFLKLIIVNDNSNLSGENDMSIHGAYCNINLGVLELKNIISTTSLILDNGADKFIACVADVENVPTDARELIANKLSQGVRLSILL